jgi:hypothetical protein
MSSVNHEYFFQKLEAEGSLLNDPAMLGWGFLPNEQTAKGGYFDEHTLRILADEIERRNKPFWDEYDRYCEELAKLNPDEKSVDKDTFSEFKA